MTPAMTPERLSEIRDRHLRHEPIIAAALDPEKLFQSDSLSGPDAGALHWAHVDRRDLLTELTRRDEVEAALRALAENLAGALERANKIIAEGAMTGFQPLEGDWADRLFNSQQGTSAALTDWNAYKAGQKEGERK